MKRRPALVRGGYWANFKEVNRRSKAMGSIGFWPSMFLQCPWAKAAKHRSIGSVYHRGTDCFCIRCLHGWIDNDPPLLMQPAVLEEIGRAIYPEQPGFRLVDDGLRGQPDAIAPV